MFGVVVIPSFEISISCLSAFYDSLVVLQNGKKMHVYVVKSCDDGEAFWTTTLVEEDRKYGHIHVSWTLGVCIHIGAKPYPFDQF